LATFNKKAGRFPAMIHEVKQAIAFFSVLAAVSGVSSTGHAQPPSTGSGQVYPTKPIRMIVPWNPGGTTDTIARILGQKMSETWGQPVVIDIRPGARNQRGQPPLEKSEQEFENAFLRDKGDGEEHS